MKILIVDDYPTNLRVLRALLEADRHQVVDARDGAEALRVLESETVEAIISDVLMPNMDGFRFCLEVRKSPQWFALPFIIYTSSYSSDTDRDLALNAGADVYLIKPAPAPAIAAALEEAVTLAARRGEGAPRADDATDVIKQYNSALVNKLEEKNHELGRTVEDLRASELRFRQFAEHIQDVFWSASANGEVIHYASPAFEKIWGRKVADLYARPAMWVETIVPEDRPKIQAALVRLAAGVDYEAEFRITRPDGTERWVLDRGFAVRNGGGRVIGTLGVAKDITERRRTEIALGESEQRLKNIIASLHEGMVVCGLDGVMLHWNPAAVRMHGFSSASEWHRRLPDFQEMFELHTLEGRRLELAEWPLSRVIGGEQLRDCELRVRRLDCAWERILSYGGQVVHDSAGRPTAYLTIADITERKRAEEALRLFRALVDSSEDTFEVVDPATGRFLDVNERGCRDLGHTREEYLALSVPDIHPGLDAAAWPGLVAEIRAEGSRLIQGEHRRKDGSTFPVEVRVKLVQLDREYLVASVRDITERNRAEAAVRESETRFRQLAESIHEVFWMTDPAKQQMLYVSPAYEKIWGRSCASLYTQPQQWLDAIHPDDRPRVRAALAEQTTGEYDVTYRVLRPDGEVRWIHDRAFPIRDAAGTVFRVAGVAEDVTKHHKLEEEYRQAQKMEAIGTLAGGIAHDFNNILAAMNGYAELARMNTPDPQVRDYLDAVLRAGARAVDLVKQILAFSRQQRHERAPIQLRHVALESLKLLRATIPSTIAFEQDLARDTTTVLADATQVQQILMNLGTNAWHAMRDRPGQLTVKLENFEVDEAFAELHPRLKPGPHVRLSVSDTGCGIEAATLQRIFEPFFTTKAPGEGTGLGLAVVHGIMESHEGLITVYSEMGAGTVFHLYFPAHAGEAVAPAAPAGAAPRGAGRRILYVDDEEPLAKLGQRMLEQLGYVVDAHTDVRAALAAFRADPARYDLVVTDQTMPNLTGVDFARELLQVRPGLPVLLTTGYSPSLTVEKVRALGLRDLLPKPHTLYVLGQAVHRALEDAPRPA